MINMVHRGEQTVGKLGIAGKNFRTFYQDVIRKPQFFFPFSALSIMGYLPSLVNTKFQFEDFNWDLYYGNSGLMRTGRWWMWLVGRSFSLTQNDLVCKYLGFLFMVMGALLISCSLYCLSEKKGIFKYTLAAATVVIFPLINEIWSYNPVNLLVSMNTFYCGLATYFLIHHKGHFLKRLLLASVPFMLISSSYESGLFQYITLVLCLCAYIFINQKLKIREYFLVGTYFAVPLLLGTLAGLAIGRLVSVIGGIPYEKYGDTASHWASGSARAEITIGNLDRYFLRALVYVPIAVFVFASVIFAVIAIRALIRKRWWVFISLCLTFASVFFLSFIQGSHLTYRSAQTVTVFTMFVFFLLAEWSEGCPDPVRRGVCVLMGVVCLMESSFLMKVNLTDYRSAHNDEDLVRQLGYDLTAHHRGKPVVLTGHIFDLSYLPSRMLLDQITVDTTTPNGKAYDTLIQKLNGGVSAEGMKYFETNLWSVLYLTSVDAECMEQFFSYCGYDIRVVPSDLVETEYPAAAEIISSREIQPLEIVDLEDCEIVGI